MELYIINPLNMTSIFVTGLILTIVCSTFPRISSGYIIGARYIKPVRKTEYRWTISLYFTDNAASIKPTPIENIIIMTIGIADRNIV
jgi:hypothetical protein